MLSLPFVSLLGVSAVAEVAAPCRPRLAWNRGPPCAVCARATAKDQSRDRFSYWHCATCNVHMLAPDLHGKREQLFAASYFRDGDQNGYFDYLAEARCHRQNASARLRQLAVAGAHGGRLLEIGPAAGFLLEAAQARGFHTVGVDISEWSQQETTRRTGAVVHRSLAAVPRPPQGFQAVAMVQVLEHMTDAPETLRSVGRLMQPGGVLLIEDWDADSPRARRLGHRWQEFSPPFVVWMFGRAALVRMLEQAGFAVETVATPGKRISVGRVLHKLLGNSLCGRVLCRVARRLGLFRLSLRYRGKDLITVVARRR
jgi:2-polyprenyl-3-methyl-5-hydroxy-6-metoxy-1,4-benzoquinol methylase